MAFSQPPLMMVASPADNAAAERRTPVGRVPLPSRVSPDLVALIVAAFASATALYFWMEREVYTELLTIGAGAQAARELTPEDRLLIPTAIIGKTFVACTPAILLGFALRWLRVRGWLATFCALAVLANVLLVFDLGLYRSVGRHLREVLGFAALPDGMVAAGDATPWLFLVAKTVLFSVIAVPVSAFSALWLIRRAAGSARAALVRLLAGMVVVLSLLAALGPHFLIQSWKHRILTTLLYSSLPIDPFSFGHGGGTRVAPELEELHRRFTESYRRLFPLVYGAKPVDRGVKLEPTSGERPNVILVVGESLRSDVFTPKSMPRLVRWAEQGLVSPTHYAATKYSEAGMFSILYGRNPLVFHATLDAGIRPQLCETLRDNGYECAYFTGHPKTWMRREEYLNETTMDRFVHDDQGPWYEWDRKALSNAVRAARQARDRPIFAIVLLMSTHFEYQYPPEYERHVPVSTTVWHMTRTSTLTARDRIPHTNRYLNSIAFLDDAVADAFEKLDTKRNIVVFTGDHGESLYEDGSFTHGRSFAEVVARVPLAIVGPRVPKTTLNEMTIHADIAPTLFGLLGANELPQHGHGVNLLAEHDERRSLLFAHCPRSRHEADALLLTDGARIRLGLGLRDPEVTIKGFEDENAALLSIPTLSPQRTEALARAFDERLDLIRR